jgi:hypothetical protein
MIAMTLKSNEFNDTYEMIAMLLILIVDTFNPALGCRIAVLFPSRRRFIELGEAIAWC